MADQDGLAASMRGPIPLLEPVLGGNAAAYLAECVETNYVSSVGPFVERFEAAFAERVGAPYAVAVSTGTAALHLALRLCDVGPGDEVWLPTLTFVASANPVRYQGATPVLCDVDATWNLDPAPLVAELDRRAAAGEPLPKAVEVVHLVGRVADMAPLVDACARHGVALVEDAAEALGARWTDGPLAGREVGTVGRVGAYSFNGNKIITAGGGGMLVTDDEALAARARHLSTQARLPGAFYHHDAVGYNYRLTNVAAALGLSQLERLDAFLATKARIAARYDALLADVAGVATWTPPSWCAPSHWLYCVSLTERAGEAALGELVAGLRERGVGARPVWTPLHRPGPYADAPRLGSLERADAIYDRALSLPCSVSLTDAQQDHVVQSLARLLEGRPNSGQEPRSCLA